MRKLTLALLLLGAMTIAMPAIGGQGVQAGPGPSACKCGDCTCQGPEWDYDWLWGWLWNWGG